MASLLSASQELPQRSGDGSGRHLSAVARPERFLDRRNLPFLPVYLELVRSPKAEQPGYGLTGNAALFYSVLLHFAGTPADGRRQSRSELAGEKFVKRTPSAGKLRQMYGWTYDQIEAWSTACAEPRLCPHCGRGHALLQIGRSNGRRNTYTILRCQDLADEDCVPAALIDRVKRRPTGAADPTTRPLVADPRVGLPGFDELLPQPRVRVPVENSAVPAGSKTIGQSPTVDAPESTQETGKPTSGLGPDAVQDTLQTVGQNPMVSRDGAEDHPGAVPAYSCDLRDGDRFAEAVTGRIRALEGFCIVERVTVAPEAIATIARLIEDPAELYSALIGVVTAGSIEGCSISAAFAAAVIERRAAAAELSDGLSSPVQPMTDPRAASAADERVADEPPTRLAAERRIEAIAPAEHGQWAVQRIYELASECEPWTTLARAREYYREFFAHCLKRAAGDHEAAESELARVLTDPRCCGGPGRRGSTPLKPIAMIRSGFRDGWIWNDVTTDSGSSALKRAFERDLTPARRQEVERILRATLDGQPLDYARLREHKIGSKQMIAYLFEYFGITQNRAQERGTQL